MCGGVEVLLTSIIILLILSEIHSQMDAEKENLIKRYKEEHRRMVERERE